MFYLITFLYLIHYISDPILTEADVSVIVHDIIFNRNLFIKNREICESNSDDEEWIVTSKKLSLIKLKQVYSNNKISEKDIKWLTNRDKNHSAKINYVYKYMQNIYDIDNLIMNKNKRKNSNKSNKYFSRSINKNGYRQALIYHDSITFPATDTASRLNHILASLDYWMFDTYWLYQDGNLVNTEKADNRRLFISNMYDAWNAQQKRDRDKVKKNQGIDLTNDNKKNLRHLAKACGKTQREVLNNLVESAYKQIQNQEIQLVPSSPNQYTFFDKIPLEQQYSLPSEHAEREVISEDSFLTKDKQELSSDYDAESVGSSTYDNEDVPAETIIPKQEVNILQPFYPEGSNGKQAKETADTNTENYAKL